MLLRNPNPHSAFGRRVSSRVLTAVLSALLTLCFLCGAQATWAQDESDSEPQSEELERLKVLQAEAEAREAIAKAKRAELDARFPQSTSSRLEGKTTVGEKGRVEEQVVGFISVAQAADRIAETIHNTYPNLPTLAVYNEGDIQLLLIYSAATKRVDAYIARYDKQAAAEQAALTAYPMWNIPTAPCDPKALATAGAGRGGEGFINPLGVATSLLGSFGDILSFFRTNVDIQGSTFTVSESVLVTEVFRSLRAKYANNISLYYPKEFPPDFDPTQDSPMLIKLEALFNSKANADTLAAQIAGRIKDKSDQITTLKQCQAFAGQAVSEAQKKVDAQPKVLKDLEDKIAALQRGRAGAQQRRALLAQLAAEQNKLAALSDEIAAKEQIKTQHGNDIKKLEKEIAALQAVVQPLTPLNSQADLLVKDMVKVDEKTGINPLTAFIRSERIQKLMQDTKGHWLKLNVVTAGGNTRVKTNLFVDVFNGGNRVSYSGASIVEYHLYDRSGRSLLSDTTNSYVDYMKAKDVRKFSEAAIQTLDHKTPTPPATVTAARSR